MTDTADNTLPNLIVRFTHAYANRYHPDNDHPVLGPIIEKAVARYHELKREMAFEVASKTAQREALASLILISLTETAIPTYVVEPPPVPERVVKEMEELRERYDSACRETGDLRDGVTKAIGMKWNEMPQPFGGMAYSCPDDVQIIAECARLRAQLDADKSAIRVWRFGDAPEELRKLSDNGGDEDWVALLPEGWPKERSIAWAQAGTPFGPSVDEYEWNGRVVLIGSHS